MTPGCRVWCRVAVNSVELQFGSAYFGDSGQDHRRSRFVRISRVTCRNFLINSFVLYLYHHNAPRPCHTQAHATHRAGEAREGLRAEAAVWLLSRRSTVFSHFVFCLAWSRKGTAMEHPTPEPGKLIPRGRVLK